MCRSLEEIDRIGHGVLDRTLPKREWTHAAHFAAAFWVLTRPGMHAERDMPGLIRAYNEATGTPNTDTGGYHETITLASLRASRAWLEARAKEPLHAALEALLASEYGRSDWLLAYWSKPVLFSVLARRTWVEPDLRPLPF
jgi:sirohydrochlorin ferrochelatase